MANWWDAAPLANQGGNWWDDAPLAEQSNAPEQPPQQSSQREGLFPQFASGMTEGGAALLNAPANVLTPIEMGLRSIGPGIVNMLGGQANYPTPDQSWLPRPGDSLVNFGENIGAMTAPSDDGTGRIVRRVGQEVGANMIPAIGMMSRAPTVASALAQGGIELGLAGSSGAGAGVANELFPGNPVADLAGQVVGYGVGSGLINAGTRAITPNPMTPEQIATRDYLQSQGVDLTAGQATGNKGLQYSESELGGVTAENFTDMQSRQFTSAALDRIGVNADAATPDVMRTAYRNIGDEFDRLASNTTLPLDRQLDADLQASVTNYQGMVGDANQAPVVQRYVDEVYDLASRSSPGQPLLTGDQYRSLRSRLNETIRGATNLDVKNALQDVQSSLDDAVERYLSSADPDLLGQWRDVRRQYRDYLILERAASGAGEKAAQGIITPAQLSAAVKSFEGRRGFVQGRGDFTDLARAGVSAMSPLPNSGTAQRTAARTMLAGGPTIAGALLGSQAGGGDLTAGVLGGFAGAQIPNQVGKALLSPVGRRYLSNQALPGVPVTGANSQNLVVRALAAQGAYDN